jgi:hypothetical protein
LQFGDLFNCFLVLKLRYITMHASIHYSLSLSLFSVDLVASKDYEFSLDSKLLRSLRYIHPWSSMYILMWFYFFNINVVWALSSCFWSFLLLMKLLIFYHLDQYCRYEILLLKKWELYVRWPWTSLNPKSWLIKWGIPSHL